MKKGDVSARKDIFSDRRGHGASRPSGRVGGLKGGKTYGGDAGDLEGSLGVHFGVCVSVSSFVRCV